MKDCKRLTKKDSCYYDDMERIDDLGGADILYDRLAELEDKIEGGELCEREEVRKETARTCIILAKQYQNGKKIVRDIAEKYDIDLEVEE